MHFTQMGDKQNFVQAFLKQHDLGKSKQCSFQGTNSDLKGVSRYGNEMFLC